MTSESEFKILKILFFIFSFIMFFFIGFVLTLFFMVDKVYAVQEVPSSCNISWKTNASTYASANCYNSEPNIGGYTDFFNLLQSYNNTDGSQTWHFSVLIDLYVIDYGNQDGDFIQTPFMYLYFNNTLQTITNLTRLTDTQYVTCDDPNNCVRHRIYNFSFDWVGSLNGTLVFNFISGNDRADCGWLQDNPSTCTSSYPRVHWLSTTASYSDGGRFDDISQDLNDQTTILNGAINDSTTSINSNNNSNTQTIINNNNSNTQTIVNNINDNLTSCIPVKNIFNVNSESTNQIINSNGNLQTNNNYKLWGYIPIQSVVSYSASYTLSADSQVRFGWYDENYNFIRRDLVSNGSHVISPINARYLRINYNRLYVTDLMVTKGSEAQTYEPYTCQEINKIDGLNNSVDNVNNSLNNLNGNITNSNVSVDDSDFNNMNSNIATNSVISDLLLLPVTLFQSILNSVNGTCSSFTLGRLFGTNLTMPCINVQSYLGSALYSVIDVLISGFFILSIRKKFVDIFNHITSLKDGGNELE